MTNDQDFILLVCFLVLAAILAQLIYERTRKQPTPVPQPYQPSPQPFQSGEGSPNRHVVSADADTSLKSSEESESFIMALMEENKGSELTQINSRFLGMPEIREVSDNERTTEVMEGQLKSPRCKHSEKEKKRLEFVKKHYKDLLAVLQFKLEELSRKHNESIDQIDVNETIVFSEESGMSLIHEGEQLELNLEEVNHLKEELELHQEILTNVLEEERQLKSQVRELEEQNSLLKSIASPEQVKSRVLSDRSQVNTQGDKLTPATSQLLELHPNNTNAHIKNLYSSIITLPDNVLEKSLGGSKANRHMGNSTITMMSIVEGVINLGLLGECRFLNEISKRFLLGEVRKVMRSRIQETELLLSYVEGQEESDDVVGLIDGPEHLLFLIKLANGKNVAVFTLHPFSTVENAHDDEALIVDLCKRKGYTQRGLNHFDEEYVVWGSGEIVVELNLPMKVTSQSQQCRRELLDVNEGQICISHLQIYRIIPQED